MADARAGKPGNKPDTGLIVVGLIVGGCGLYLMLAGLGLFAPPAPVHAPGFIIVCAGLAFAGGGGSVAIRGLAGCAMHETELPAETPRGIVMLSAACGIVAFAPLAIVATRIAVGPRVFSGAILFGPLSETAGRIVFGIGAIVAWLALAGFIHACARKLRTAAPRTALRTRKYEN